MAWTPSDLAAVEAALKVNAKTVQYADRRVEYQNIADLLLLKSAIEAELSGTGGTPAIVRQIRPIISSGW